MDSPSLQHAIDLRVPSQNKRMSTAPATKVGSTSLDELEQKTKEAGSSTIPRKATVIIVGAGPAGLGTAALLKQCGIDVVVLERGEVGQTFKAW